MISQAGASRLWGQCRWSLLHPQCPVTPASSIISARVLLPATNNISRGASGGHRGLHEEQKETLDRDWNIDSVLGYCKEKRHLSQKLS